MWMIFKQSIRVKGTLRPVFLSPPAVFMGRFSGVAMIRFLSKIEQVAAHLREEIQSGRWKSTIPGRNELARELGINSKTVEAALQQLEQENLLLPQGAGRRRRIMTPNALNSHSLRVAVLDYEPATRSENYMVSLLHLLTEAGHVAFSTKKTLLELGMKVERVAKMVAETQADAWVVVGGSREVLQWFTAQPFPVFALFGRRRGLPIAGTGPDKLPAMAALTRQLIELGHHRIVLLVRAERRLPKPGATERAFLSTLDAHGLTPSAYHLPDWEESVEAFHQCLEELFRLTPPTALIVDEAPFIMAVMQFCSRRGIRVPEDVSLVCCDADPNFSWCKPSITHIRWDSRPVVRRIVRWAANVSRGKIDQRQTQTPAKLVEGGTMGPASRKHANFR
jgi:DNA-binding LacI/PurR family transcriptional regulator/biotin operon repressor